MSVATKLKGMSQVISALVFRTRHFFLLVTVEGVMGNPVTLRALIFLRVRFHTEECC